MLARANILVSGGTGTGKTTLLNVCSGFIPIDERIVTIEDAAELQLHQEHVCRLEARPADVNGEGRIAIRELVINSLRMRPDRIVVGECRGGEALDMLQAMNTGHDGSLTTIHANSPRETLSRLETLVLMAGLDLPLKAIRQQIAGAINLIIQLNRLKDGSRKVVSFTEVIGMEGEMITVQEIFKFESRGADPSTGKIIGDFEPTGIRPAHHRQAVRHGHRASAASRADLPGPSPGWRRRREERTPQRGRLATSRVSAAGVAVVALSLLAACGGATIPVASVASVPTVLSTPAPTAAPSAGPAIGDVCPVGTWRVLKDTLVVSFETTQGIVSVTIAGGAGELDHYFSNGTVVENLAGTAFTGSAHGYRVTMRASGTLRSPVVFTNGRLTAEPIDSSAEHLTITINGSGPKSIPQAEYETLTYTCSGNALTERDSTGDISTYRRVSSTP